MAVEKFEHVPCDLCGADAADPVLELKDCLFETTTSTFHLVRCRSCGLMYLNPRPAPDQMDSYYQRNYAPFSRSGLAGRAKRLTIARDVNALRLFLAPPARVIDVGCATGDLLQVIRERGNSNVLGIEPSPHAARVARDRWGLEVFGGTLEEARLPGQSVDVALLAHTIEHLPSPSTTVGELNRVLRTGGALVLWLPNAASIAARALATRWIGYDAPRHLYSFTPATLGRLLDEHGFTVHSVSHEWIGLEWSWALRLAARERFPDTVLERVVSAAHPALTLGLSPLSIAGALLGRGGRIRVTAIKRDRP